VPIEKGFHGSIERKKHFHNLMPHKCRFLVVPDRIAGPTKRETIDRGVQFIKETHKKYDWEWN